MGMGARPQVEPGFGSLLDIIIIFINTLSNARVPSYPSYLGYKKGKYISFSK